MKKKVKILLKSQMKMLFKEMIIEGVISIKEGENPKYIEEKLLNFLENGKKDEDSSSGKEE